jgi:hypothetical protein
MVDAITPAIQTALHPVTLMIKTVIDTIALAVKVARCPIMAIGGRPVGKPVEAVIDDIPAVIQTVIDHFTAVVKTSIDTITARIPVHPGKGRIARHRQQ